MSNPINKQAAEELAVALGGACLRAGVAEGGEPASFYAKDKFGPEESVGYLMRCVMQLFVTEVDHRLSDVGLTNAQWGPMFYIHKHGTATLAELARELRVDPGALTRTLDRLEGKGLVARERSTEDRRVVNLVLTPDGKEAVAPVPGVLCDVMNSVLTGFSHEEWQTLLDYLRRMRANANTLRQQPTSDNGAR